MSFQFREDWNDNWRKFRRLRWFARPLLIVPCLCGITVDFIIECFRWFFNEAIWKD